MTEGDRHAPRGLVDAAAWVLPSALSSLRLVCAVLFPVLDTPGRLALIVIAAASDGLDGLAARALGRTTWWGAWLDAGSDKIFAVTVVIDLLVRGQLAWWQLPLLLARDLTVTGIFAYAATRGSWQRIKRAGVAAPLGKLTTATLFVLFVVLVGWPDRPALVWPIMIVAMALSVAAAVDYARRLWHALRDGS